MLPLAHIYVSTEVAGRKTPLLVFGSVIPDMAMTSREEIGWDEIHGSPKKLYDFTLKNYPEFVDLALGVRLHSHVEKGADYYSDSAEEGFAIREGKKIKAEVAELFRETEDKKAILYSHSFIEAAVDIMLLRKRPSILRLYKSSVDQLDFGLITSYLADYLKMDRKVISAEVERFLNLVGPKAYTSEKILVDRLMILVKMRRGEVGRKGLERILEKAIKIVEDKYLGYLDKAVQGMKEDFTGIL